jgi:hypothetical protein
LVFADVSGKAHSHDTRIFKNQKTNCGLIQKETSLAFGSDVQAAIIKDKDLPKNTEYLGYLQGIVIAVVFQDC